MIEKEAFNLVADALNKGQTWDQFMNRVRIVHGVLYELKANAALTQEHHKDVQKAIASIETIMGWNFRDS